MNHIMIKAALAAAALLCGAGAYGRTEVRATDPEVLFMGRTVAQPDGSRAFTFPGVSAQLNFEGSSLQMSTTPGSGYYMVEIDGGEPFKVHYADGDSVLTLADGLGAGSHHARVTYAIEGYEKRPAIRSFAVDGPGAAVLAPPRRPALRLEFIGNSLTCGYGTEAPDQYTKFAYDNENHTLAFPYLIARELGADVNVVARSGIGVYRNYGGPREGNPDSTMSHEYDNALLYDNSKPWDFTSFRPHIICINLGTNDTSLNDYDINLYEAAAASFVDHVRAVNHGAIVVLLTGPALTDTRLADVKGALDRVAATRPGVYRFDMSPQTGELGYGADWHPSSAQHRRMAAELLPFLKSLM